MCIRTYRRYIATSDLILEEHRLLLYDTILLLHKHKYDIIALYVHVMGL